MNEFEIKKLIQAELEAAGIKIPVENKFDYSGLKEPEKAKEFIRLCKGDLSNAIYVNKDGEKYGDPRYYDLLFVVNERGEPVCIPVPIVRKLFGGVLNAVCRDVMTGDTYEYIYKAYYDTNSLPF